MGGKCCAGEQDKEEESIEISFKESINVTNRDY